MSAPGPLERTRLEIDAAIRAELRRSLAPGEPEVKLYALRRLRSREASPTPNEGMPS